MSYECCNCRTVYNEPLKICEICGKDMIDPYINKIYNELWNEMEKNLFKF